MLQTIAEVAAGCSVGRPHRLHNEPPELKRAITTLTTQIEKIPGLPNARWVALRLLDGDERIITR